MDGIDRDSKNNHEVAVIFVLQSDYPFVSIRGFNSHLLVALIIFH